MILFMLHSKWKGEMTSSNSKWLNPLVSLDISIENKTNNDNGLVLYLIDMTQHGIKHLWKRYKYI